MAIKTREELLTSINALLGENTSDEALGFIEDLTDTVTDFESKTADQTNWKSKYEENDNMWRNKYKERFMNGSAEEPPKKPFIGDSEPDALTFDKLFKEG